MRWTNPGKALFAVFWWKSYSKPVAKSFHLDGQVKIADYKDKLHLLAVICPKRGFKLIKCQ